MGFFTGQLSNVVEWEEFREDMLFWKWSNREIKKGSKLILRPGQDAVFLFNGKSEGIFTDDGSYDIESEIIPFLSTLSGFKFGFNSGMRAEVLFINTKEFTVKWGTKNAINIPVQELEKRMNELEKYKDKEIIVYCSHSHRSPRASYMLTQNGFKKVTNMLGGMSVWKDQVKKNDCNERLYKQQ